MTPSLCGKWTRFVASRDPSYVPPVYLQSKRRTCTGNPKKGGGVRCMIFDEKPKKSYVINCSFRERVPFALHAILCTEIFPKIGYFACFIWKHEVNIFAKYEVKGLTKIRKFRKKNIKNPFNPLQKSICFKPNFIKTLHVVLTTHFGSPLFLWG